MRPSPAVVSIWARRAAGFCVLLLAVIAWTLPAAAQTVTPAWAKAFGNSNDFIQSTAGDADGNVYIAGYMSSASITIGTTTLTRVSGTSDMVVAKLDANGAAVWAKNFGGATATTVRGYGIAVDSAGNAYVAGYFQGAAIDIGGTSLTLQGTISTAVAKLDAADGSTAWAVRFGNTGASTVPNGIALDSSNNPVVAGYFSGADTVFGGTTLTKVGTQDLYVAKLANANGAPTWAVNFGGTGVSANTAGVALDTTGNVYTFGYFAGGNMVFGVTTLTLDGTRNFWLSKLDSTGAHVWARNYGGTGVSNPTVSTYGSLAVDGSGNSYFASSFHSGSLVVGSDTLPSVGGSSNALQTVVVAKIDSSGTAAWARSFGTAASNSRAVSIKLDAAGNPYVTGYFTGATLSVGGTTLTRIGSQDAFVARYDGTGNVTWVRNYGGSNGSSNATVAPVSVATASTSGVVVGGNFTGYAVDFGATTISPGAGQTMFLADLNQTFQLTAAVTGTGTVTSTPAGISCGATCTAQFNAASSVTLTAVAGTGYSFTSWSGDCSGATAAVSVTMSATRSCTATFTANGGGGGSGGGGSTPTPPPPPPPFVNTSNPPPTVIAADTTGSGQGTVSFASSFSNPASLTFTASQTSGAALPSWLTFDPATVSFNYNVPLPATLPVQPSADVASDAADRAAKAGRSIVNTVYPLAVWVQTVPVTLTASGNGQTYTATINMDFYAPRSPVAMTAVSYSAGGASGNAASVRPALSWDGGQVVFETLAANVNTASGPVSSIIRYHGLSGQRDLLSQTAIPGGGVANGADGNSNNPAVSAAGNYAAFSSVAPSVSATSNNRLRQVYRTSLAYPRVPLNEAATPAAVMVSTTAAGVAADAAADLPSVSEQGTFVAFESAAGNLGANPDRLSQIWRKDVGTGAIVLVSSTWGGVAGNGDSRNVSLSWDGTVAVFDSTATNLVPGGVTGRHVYLKNLVTGGIYRLSTAAGSGNARVDGRAGSVVYVSSSGGKSQVLRYDVGTGATSVVSVTASGVGGNGDSTQPSMSADGRFVAFRSTSTDLVAGYADNGQAQIWVRDVMRGVTALVTQAEGGAPGNGASSDPAVSGDGSSIGFSSLSTNLVNGTPLPGQIHLAANPLVLPGRTAYWAATGGGNQAWSIERWGDQAFVAGLGYAANGGTAVWAAGTCRFSGLICQGTLNQWSQTGTTSTAAGPVTLAFASDGSSATVTFGSSAGRSLVIYPIGGLRTTGYAGLPQNGYWNASGNAPGVTSLFVDTDTQAATNGSSVQSTHVTLFGYDTSGNAQWYAAEGTMGPDQAFSGTLYLYAGGAALGQATGNGTPSATALGTLRLNFTATDRATVQLPDGRTATVSRWRF